MPLLTLDGMIAGCDRVAFTWPSRWSIQKATDAMMWGLYMGAWPPRSEWRNRPRVCILAAVFFVPPGPPQGVL